MTAWIAVLCIGAISLTFRIAPLAFAGRTTSPRASRFIKDAGAAAVAAITVASFDRAAQSGDVAALAVAGVVGFVLALRGRVDVARRHVRARDVCGREHGVLSRDQRVAASGALALLVATVLSATNAAINSPVTSTGSAVALDARIRTTAVGTAQLRTHVAHLNR